MKKLLLILFCLPMIGFGQGWDFYSGGNDFDGEYRVAFVKGKGTDYPYNSPTLVINYFENDKQVNFYIKDAGYYSSNYLTKVKFSFSNEKGTIYESTSVGYSKDNNSVFLGDLFSPKNTTRFEIFQKLMTASSVNIRVESEFSQNDLTFTLKGSSKAIKYALEYEKMFENYNLKKKQKSIRDSLLNFHLNKYNLSDNFIDKIIGSINKRISENDYTNNKGVAKDSSNFLRIDSIALWKTSISLSANIFFKYADYTSTEEFVTNSAFWYFMYYENEDLGDIKTYDDLMNSKGKEMNLKID